MGLRFLLCLGGVFCGSVLLLHADVRMPAIFGDHMVLQEGTKLPVWGTADPGEKVTVAFGGETGAATAAADGAWRVDLDPVAFSAEARTLTVAGRNTLAFQDVLVGDVWLASGQSNMEFGIQSGHRNADAIPQADDPQVRFFLAPQAPALDPQADFPPTAATSLDGKWQVCTPELLAKKWRWNGFSAVSYYFSREIRRRTGHPVGVIGSYWGGTPAQAWTSLAALRQAPELARFISTHDAYAAGYAQAKAAYPQKMADFGAALKQWTDEVGAPLDAATAQWAEASKAAAAAGQPAPLRPVPSRPKPSQPASPDGGSQGPANLFNGMIAPLIPYALKGAIWYQGESNASSYGSGREYATLFPTMISDWRRRWGQGDFPFLFVQLANFRAPATTPSEGEWPWVREAQFQTLSLPHTGMASAVDIGDPINIHPLDKWDVGMRLALAARRVAYGEEIVASGPLYESMKVEGNRIRISFANHDGLAMGVPPWTPTGATPPVPTELAGFGIAGADRKFVWAKAAVDGNDVVVSSDQVAEPVAVRYDWADCPAGNLYNRAGLPASPFRTDDWVPEPPVSAKAPAKAAAPAPSAQP